jgi:GcrA cell cycle regulator
MPSASWTEAQIEILKRHWNNGKSAREIAEMPGMAGLSRNAVIGKAQRLGLGATPALVQRKRRNGAKRSRRRAEASGVAPASRRPPKLTLVSRRITMIDLTEHTCRYPFGERPRDLTFCGAPPIAGSPYCAKHDAACHQPWTPKTETSAA